MDSVVDIVAAYLEAQNLAGGYQIFRGFEPPSPDKAITVLEFGGMGPDTTFQASYPAFQVRVRSAPWGYADARGKIQELFDAVHGSDEVSDASVSPNQGLAWVIADQQPFPTGQDDLNRVTFAFNCRSMRTT